MDLASQLARQLKADEGLVLHAYTDPLGFLTIGYGRMIDDRKGGGITEEEAVYLLGNDIATRERALRKSLPWYDRLSDARKGVLLNMAYQMGVSGLLAFQRTLDAVRDERYADAAHHMLQSLWAQQTPSRARKMAHQMTTGEWQ